MVQLQVENKNLGVPFMQLAQLRRVSILNLDDSNQQRKENLSAKHVSFTCQVSLHVHALLFD